MGRLIPTWRRRSAPTEMACETSVRPPRGQRARVVAAAAVAHERDAPPARPPQREGLALDALESAVRAAGVGHEAGRVGPVADTPQPQREDGERLVAGPQARCEQDRAAVAVRHAAAVEHRVDDEPGELGRPARLRQRPAPPLAHPGRSGGVDIGARRLRAGGVLAAAQRLRSRPLLARPRGEPRAVVRPPAPLLALGFGRPRRAVSRRVVGDAVAGPAAPGSAG